MIINSCPVNGSIDDDNIVEQLNGDLGGPTLHWGRTETLGTQPTPTWSKEA